MKTYKTARNRARFRWTIHRLSAAAMILMALSLVDREAQGQSPPSDWARIEEETLRHFQSLLRLDTSSPPGNESRAVEYLKGVLEKEGISVRTFALDPARANLVATLKGNGSKRPLLMMAHTDVVSVDATKWTFPPFGAERDGGYVYGRGAIDDKDTVVASLMVMLLLKRQNLPLDRDVIFLAEAGEEGEPNVGINFMVERHYAEIDAEYCLAEGGEVRRVGGTATFAGIQALEKHARTVQLTARGTSGHASVPLPTNPVSRLSAAVAAVTAWQAPVRLNEITRSYFARLAGISTPEQAARYRAVLSPGSKEAAEAFAYFLRNEPNLASMLHTSVSPTIISGGYRVNVIPSEAKATLDVRMVPDQDPAEFLDTLRSVVNDSAVDVSYGPRVERPRSTTAARLDSEAFRVIESAVNSRYGTIAIPTMSTGASDMAQLRAKGVQCFGIGPGTDVEDGARGFGAHSDQERILESELHRFVRFAWDVVSELARAQSPAGR
jgi:acetylornithine deacetylase/succinyl-diaminopimelate desuccinylase-like protein